jgi:hypothetical protein
VVLCAPCLRQAFFSKVTGSSSDGSGSAAAAPSATATSWDGASAGGSVGGAGAEAEAEELGLENVRGGGSAGPSSPLAWVMWAWRRRRGPA